MLQLTRWIPILTVTCMSMGCAICCGPDDYNYPTYGGKHQRSDMQYGRVGSVFSDTSGTTLNLTPHTELAQGYQPQEIDDDQQSGGGEGSELPVPQLQRPNANDGDNQGINTTRGVRYRRGSRAMPGTNRTNTPNPPTRVYPSTQGPTPAPATAPRRRQSRSFLGGRRY